MTSVTDMTSPTPLVYLDDEELKAMFDTKLALLRFYIARYDLTNARLLNRELDRIEAEQKSRIK